VRLLIQIVRLHQLMLIATRSLKVPETRCSDWAFTCPRKRVCWRRLARERRMGVTDTVQPYIARPSGCLKAIATQR